MEQTGVNGFSKGTEVDANIVINILTPNSQSYTLRVNKQITLSALNEQIASLTGVPSDHQCLIYQGSVLRDDPPLSAHHVEDGDTVHLISRPPGTMTHLSSQTGSASNTPEPFPGANQDEGLPPILTLLLVSTLLGSLGANGPERVQAVDLQGPPDTLQMLSQYRRRLRGFFVVDEPHRREPDFASTSHAAQDTLPQPELLAELFFSTREMLVNPVADSFLNLREGLLNRGNLDDERRHRYQEYAQRMGNSIQHLGSYFLELGRIMMSVGFGQNDQLVVNAGPAMFISPSGPNPLVVQRMNSGTTVASVTGGSSFSSVNEYDVGPLIAVRDNLLPTIRPAFAARPIGQFPSFVRTPASAARLIGHYPSFVRMPAFPARPIGHFPGSVRTPQGAVRDNGTVRYNGAVRDNGTVHDNGAVRDNSTNGSIEPESVATAPTVTNMQETEPGVPRGSEFLSNLLRQMIASVDFGSDESDDDSTDHDESEEDNGGTSTS